MGISSLNKQTNKQTNCIRTIGRLCECDSPRK